MFERFSKEARAQKKLTAAFNNAAKMEEALTKLHKENPKFDFDWEKNEKGAYFVTNIPLMRAGKIEGMSIDITPGRRGIHLTVDTSRLPGRAKDYDELSYTSVREAVSAVKRYMKSRASLL